MIEVTKLNGETIMVNADHIETVEAHPDTTLVLRNDKRIVVKDTVAEVVRKVVEYQRGIRMGPPGPAGPRAGAAPYGSAGASGPGEGTV
jgi:flagellar protein FlbD